MKLDQVGERFANDVSRHELTVLRNDGMYRHLRLARPDSNVFSFDLVTWPGHLVITGDMGTYVFVRDSDMFAFFRSASGRPNETYWAEKMAAGDTTGPLRRFDADLVAGHLRSTLADWLEEYEEGDPARAELTEAVEDLISIQVLSHKGDDIGESLAQALSDFNIRGYRFDDWWSWTMKSLDYRAMWCLWAIPWAISRYDDAS